MLFHLLARVCNESMYELVMNSCCSNVSYLLFESWATCVVQRMSSVVTWFCSYFYTCHLCVISLCMYLKTYETNSFCFFVILLKTITNQILSYCMIIAWVQVCSPLFGVPYVCPYFIDWSIAAESYMGIFLITTLWYPFCCFFWVCLCLCLYLVTSLVEKRIQWKVYDDVSLY